MKKSVSLTNNYLFDIVKVSVYQKEIGGVMAKINHTKYIILGLLNHDEMSGYDIKQRIDQALSYFWDAGYGQIYPTLKSMTTDNLIHQTQVVSEKGPDKQTYTLTDLGREDLKSWLKEPANKEHVRYEVLLKLFFSGATASEDALHNIAVFKDRNAAHLKMMHLFSAELKSILQTSPDHLYYYLTTRFGEKVYTAYLEWADEATALIYEAQKRKDLDHD